MILSTEYKWYSEFLIRDINTDTSGWMTELQMRQHKRAFIRYTTFTASFEDADLGDYASVSFWDDKQFVSIKWMFVYDIKAKKYTIQCTESVKDYGKDDETVVSYIVDDSKITRVEDAVNA